VQLARPSEGPKLPAAQLSQGTFVPGEKLPTLQLLHASKPVSAVYWPLVHAVQLGESEDAENVPAAQLLHELDPAAEY